MNILVVDDELDIKTLFEQRFRKEIRSGQLSLVFAGNGAEALNILNKDSQNIPIILSDINMPVMNGLDLLKNVRERYTKPAPSVIMITAYGDQENYNHCKSLGADELISKPVDFNNLKELIAGKLNHTCLS